MLKESIVEPAWTAFNGSANPTPETKRENSDQRVTFGGPGLELLRRVQVQHLRAYMDAFYEHGSAADICALCAAFELLERGWREKAHCDHSQAAVLEALLAALGFPARELLDSSIQRRPSWPV